MTDFTARFERLELKFLIEEDQADRVRDQIGPYCTVDPNSAGPSGYTISSLYLDSPSLAFHRAKERGDPDRIKLRVRTYSKDSPATLEMKRRRSNVIDKTRAMVARDLAATAAQGRLDLQSGDEAGFLRDFSRVVATAGAEPTLNVRYEREAYQSQVDDYARVTFDRAIRVSRARDWNLQPASEDWCPFDDHWKRPTLAPPVVMEIKCPLSVPGWVMDVIRSNRLVQTSFSKYSVGIHVTDCMDGRIPEHSRAAKALAG